MTTDIVLLAGMAAAALRIAILQNRVRLLEEQAITDPLTGAFNRRQMQITLAAAVERRRRSGERASILLFDIDRFKDINDALGHAEGDRVLTSLVALVGQRMRKLDALFRSGGEEFVLLLSGTRFSDALSVAEDLRTLVQDARSRRRPASVDQHRRRRARPRAVHCRMDCGGRRGALSREARRAEPCGWPVRSSHHGHRRAGCPQPDALSAAHLVIEIGRALEPRSRPHESFVSLKELAPPIPT